MPKRYVCGIIALRKHGSDVAENRKILTGKHVNLLFPTSPPAVAIDGRLAEARQSGVDQLSFENGQHGSGAFGNPKASRVALAVPAVEGECLTVSPCFLNIVVAVRELL
jgi:hypothetical protein